VESPVENGGAREAVTYERYTTKYKEIRGAVEGLDRRYGEGKKKGGKR